MHTSLRTLLAAFLLILMTGASRGAASASDNANNYGGNWSNGSNQGTGFQPWQFTSGTANSGFFIGSSGVIDTNGSAFGFFANTGDTAAAVRPFSSGTDASSILEPGQSFSMSFANGTVQSGSNGTGTVGFGLQNSVGTSELQVYYIGGQADYTLDYNSEQFDTGISGTSADGLHVTYIQDAGTGFTLDLTPLSTGSTSVFNGSLPAADISQVRIFDANAGPGSGANVYANSLQVVPEGSTAWMAGCGAAALLLLKRRRWQARG